MQTLSKASRTAEHRSTVHKQIREHMSGALCEVKSYSCDPRKLAKKKGETRHTGYLSLRLEMLLIRRAGAMSVPLWEPRMCQWRKQDQEQFALSGTSKPIHLKMWPLAFWLSHRALDGPVLFKRKALLGWGQLECIPWSAMSQKMCPSWLCSLIIVPTLFLLDESDAEANGQWGWAPLFLVCFSS